MEASIGNSNVAVSYQLLEDFIFSTFCCLWCSDQYYLAFFWSEFLVVLVGNFFWSRVFCFYLKCMSGLLFILKFSGASSTGAYCLLCHGDWWHFSWGLFLKEGFRSDSVAIAATLNSVDFQRKFCCQFCFMSESLTSSNVGERVYILRSLVSDWA